MAVSAALILQRWRLAPAQAADKVVLMLNWYVMASTRRSITASQGHSMPPKASNSNPGRPRLGCDHAGGGSQDRRFGYVDVSHHDARGIKGAPVVATGCCLQTSPMSGDGLCREEHQEPRHQGQDGRDQRRRISMTQIWPLFLKKTGLKKAIPDGRRDGQTKVNAVINGQPICCSGYVMDQSMKIKDAPAKDVYPIKFADYAFQHGFIGINRQHRLRFKANTDLGQAFYVGDHKGGEAAEEGRQGRGAIDPRCHPRAARSHADAGL